jgi:hypothetical protein
MADLTATELVERLERVPLYRWSGDSEPEYQVSDTPAQAAKRILDLEARCNERMAEIQRAREIIERLSASKEKFFLALVDVKHRCVAAVDAQPFERLRAINGIADVVLEALANTEGK